jgi:hypothetical protein
VEHQWIKNAPFKDKVLKKEGGLLAEHLGVDSRLLFLS